MGKGDKEHSEIVRAAGALEEEIVRLETISRSTRKIELNSEKRIARAAAELNETLTLPERLAERLQAVAAALSAMQERQRAAIEPLTAFASELQRRTDLLGAHMRRFGALGQAAADLNTQLATSAGDAATISKAEATLQELSEGARLLFEATRADDFPEIAREADVLKQRMAALSKRIGRSA